MEFTVRVAQSTIKKLAFQRLVIIKKYLSFTAGAVYTRQDVRG
jgi:hypothetical protein